MVKQREKEDQSQTEKNNTTIYCIQIIFTMFWLLNRLPHGRNQCQLVTGNKIIMDMSIVLAYSSFEKMFLEYLLKWGPQALEGWHVELRNVCMLLLNDFNGDPYQTAPVYAPEMSQLSRLPFSTEVHTFIALSLVTK